MSNSPFIEGSKHKGLTKMVEDHFAGAKPDATGMSPEDAKGANATNALPKRSGPDGFNSDAGVNYVPRSQAGHKSP